MLRNYFSAACAISRATGSIREITVERRTREIGIRKALGAFTSDLTRLLLWQFAKPVLAAKLIAWPLAGWLM